MQMTERLSQLKFLKDQIGFVLDGSKTLEVRPRSDKWIQKMLNSSRIELTWGARFAPPRVFAVARLEKVEVRPFETTTIDDLKRISRGWENKTPEEFARVHNEWYAKELAKGYSVAWIYFNVEDVSRN